MRMHFVDWGIVLALFAVVTVMATLTKRYLKSVADFLAANRCAGPYLLAVAEGTANCGALTIIMLFEIYYAAGFSAYWWFLSLMPLATIATLTGWVYYRFRQTTAMTMAQFFEMRYSRKFRVFMGMLGFVSGVLNFGIFPAVGARFFIFFCQLPASVSVAGLFTISTFALIMFVLISISVYFTLMAGQITVMVTDWIQGIFTYAAFSVILFVTLYRVKWSVILEALLAAPANASLLHPFHTSGAKDFNIWFFVIELVGFLYGYMSWQGSQGYNCSAKSPHAALIGRVVGSWRYITLFMITLLLPVCAYAVMHHPSYAAVANSVNTELSTIANPTIREQMTVPVVLGHIFPVGVMGAMVAVMFAAFIANHNSYLHSWGCMFIQDVVMPLRKKQLTPQGHIRLLRLSVIGVAVIIFLISLLFKQTQYIKMFLALTGAIYLGGSGAAVIGGLYWSRGTTPAAWVAVILGMMIAVFGIVIHQIKPGFFINGQWFALIAMAAAISSYIILSLLGNTRFNMDKLLHRGKYAIEGDNVEVRPKQSLLLLLKEKCKFSADFTLSEKFVYMGTMLFTITWPIVYVIVILYQLFFGTSLESWIKFWHFFVWFTVVLVPCVTVWFAIGGIKDLKELFLTLRTAKRDDSDNGTVLVNRNEDVHVEKQLAPNLRKNSSDKKMNDL